MTKRFQYVIDVPRFDKETKTTWIERVVLRKTVTDKMDDRDFWKAGIAAHWFQTELRKRYGGIWTVTKRDKGFSEI